MVSSRPTCEVSFLKKARGMALRNRTVTYRLTATYQQAHKETNACRHIHKIFPETTIGLVWGRVIAVHFSNSHSMHHYSVTKPADLRFQECHQVTLTVKAMVFPICVPLGAVCSKATTQAETRGKSIYLQ